ncbi:BMC domain-containing protein [Desulfovibrio sp. JC022]|uniref:BMC domain-containing protein n=1 Tax=Desulfovibrio sp. JC022 TaxID=2593642 RepID=UPI0013D88B8A|nr:BMC domain-containing protein [Desulfovibrio sp. JC022]NDV23311.1 BMC domain-containing protein [Desulfovibrio sp. JC022]
MNSLGFIETKGLLAAIEGADAMLKAAAVNLLEKNISGGGLVTITVSGEVSAVQASVEAGAAAIARIEGAELVSRHVIARPYDELDKIIATGMPVVEAEEISREVAQSPASAAEQAEPAPAEEKVEALESPKEKSEAPAVQEFAPEAPAAPEVKEVAPAEESPKYRAAELRKMKISKVRQIARNLDGISLTNEEVKKATKKTLIDAIINVTRQIEE